jgi:superfamily II DNA or RNA helicase
VATSGLFQEGVSIDGIEVLVQAGALKSKARIIQAVGRGMRLAPGKRACTYVDFWDDDGGVLLAHSRQRMATLMAEGIRVPSVGPTRRRPGWADEVIEAEWAHVPGTEKFVRVTSDGQIVERATCLRPELVPPARCRRCPVEKRRQCARANKEL